MRGSMSFQNEPYTDFSIPANRHAIQSALEKVRAQFGQEYQARIAGSLYETSEKLRSLNPSNPAEVIGIHQKATPEMASMAVTEANAFFSEWSRTEPADRIAMLRRAAQILRARKMEF